MQQPLDYESPPRARKPAIRRVFGRTVIGAWAVFAAAFVFGALNSGDGNPLQWPSALLSGFIFLAATALTLFHWLVLIPTLWLRAKTAVDLRAETSGRQI